MGPIYDILILIYTNSIVSKSDHYFIAALETIDRNEAFYMKTSTNYCNNLT